MAHATEAAIPTENKAEAEATAPTNGSIQFEAAKATTADEKPSDSTPAASTTNEPVAMPEEKAQPVGEKTEQLTEVSNQEGTSDESAENPNLANDEETPTPNPSEEAETPLPDPSDTEEEEKPDPGKEEEKPTPNPEPEPEEEEPTPIPVPEPEEPPYEVIYIQQPAEQPVQEVIQEPVVVHSPENVVPVGPQQTTVSHGSIKFDRNLTTTEFIEEIGEAAREVGQEHDLYASVMIAQAILESGSGGSQLAQAPNYNLFGIKGEHEGKSVSFATQEDTGGGNMTTIQASFRAYDDYEDCFEDYAELLKEGISGNPDFYKGAWKTTTENYEEATAFLTGKYATDTSYNKKLNGLIETYNLTQYDHPKAEGEAAHQVASSGYLLPLNDFVVSSSFGMRGSEFHRGIDLAAGEGMPIFASKSGTVLIAEYHYSWGNYVVIQHDNGETTLYAHQRNFAVNAGERVEQGQTIGFVGSTGNSTGSHLHFELCLDSTLAVERLVDPATVLF